MLREVLTEERANLRIRQLQATLCGICVFKTWFYHCQRNFKINFCTTRQSITRLYLKSKNLCKYANSTQMPFSREFLVFNLAFWTFTSDCNLRGLYFSLQHYMAFTRLKYFSAIEKRRFLLWKDIYRCH